MDLTVKELTDKNINRCYNNFIKRNENYKNLVSKQEFYNELYVTIDDLLKKYNSKKSSKETYVFNYANKKITSNILNKYSPSLIPIGQKKNKIVLEGYKSFEESINGKSGAVKIIDTITDNGISSYKGQNIIDSRNYNNRFIKDIMNKVLTDIQKDFTTLYFYKNKNTVEIAKLKNVGVPYVGTVIRTSLKKIKKEFERKNITRDLFEI